MENYKIVRLTKPMKICREIMIPKTFENPKTFYRWLKQEYADKPLTCELAYAGGRYAVLSFDKDGNYKACAMVLEMFNNKIRGYELPTAADELQIAKFFGLN